MAVPIVYTNFVAPAIDAANLNTLNSVAYTVIGDGTNAPTSAADVRNNLGLGNTNGALPVANGGTGDTGTAWSNSTPTPTPATGAFGAATANLRVKTIGKTVFFNLIITVTATGTAGGLVSVPMPFTAATEGGFAGRESQISGLAVIGTLIGSNIVVGKYDNTYAFGNGYRAAINGVYESV